MQCFYKNLEVFLQFVVFGQNDYPREKKTFTIHRSTKFPLRSPKIETEKHPYLILTYSSHSRLASQVSQSEQRPQL